jgi:pyruvate/2-oxoglutarate dehydrogenase complex dihydrolipoamide acyltransferase (E2) component
VSCTNCGGKSDTPTGDQAASVRNAAALFTMAGRALGFGDGVRWAVDSIGQHLPTFRAELAKLERPSVKAKRLGDAWQVMLAELVKAAEARTAQAAEYSKAAANMAAELDRKPRRRRPLDRLRAAWSGLTR